MFRERVGWGWGDKLALIITYKRTRLANLTEKWGTFKLHALMTSIICTSGNKMKNSLHQTAFLNAPQSRKDFPDISWKFAVRNPYLIICMCLVRCLLPFGRLQSAATCLSESRSLHHIHHVIIFDGCVPIICQLQCITRPSFSCPMQYIPGASSWQGTYSTYTYTGCIPDLTNHIYIYVHHA